MLFTTCYQDDPVKDNGREEPCGTRNRDGKFIILAKTLKGTCKLEDLGVDKRILLKWILKNVIKWSGLIELNLILYFIEV